MGADVRLDEGDAVLELPDTPVFEGNYLWKRVVAPADDGVPSVGTACDDVPFVVGWIATGPGDTLGGAVHCPPIPTDLSELAAASSDLLFRLACLADREVTMHAAVVPPPEGGIGFSCPGIEPGWLTCGIDQVTDGVEQVPVRVPPGAQVSHGTDVEIVLRVDDPAAQDCVPPAGDRYPWPETVRVFCRVQLSLVP